MAGGRVTDHLANERTFLAWVRTSIALLGFGVVIAKLRFLLADLPAAGTHFSAAPAAGEGGRSLVLGLLFCVVALVTLVYSAVNYTQTRAMIDSDTYAPPGAMLVGFVLIVSLLAVASIVFLLQLG